MTFFEILYFVFNTFYNTSKFHKQTIYVTSYWERMS